MSDEGGVLSALAPEDDTDLQGLLAHALPRFGGQGSGGSMTIRRSPMLPGLLLHIIPVGHQEINLCAWRIAALALVLDPANRMRVDPALVGAALGLTAAESHVAVSLAEGDAIRDIALATGRSESTIRWHVKQIFIKQRISRQSELVQLVLSLAGMPMVNR